MICCAPVSKFYLLSVAEQACLNLTNTYEPRHEKTNILVSDLLRHKPGCTATEDG